MKIRNRILGMSAILLGLAAFSCDDEEEMLVPELGVGEKVLSFDENKVQTLEITSNGRWSVDAVRDTANFIISPREGYGNGTVTITLDRAKVEGINGYLKVTYMDGLKEGMQVAKGVEMVAGALENVSAGPRSLEFNNNAGYTQAPVQVNIAGKWNAELSDTTWCTIDKKSGEGEGTILVSLKENIGSKNKKTELLVAPAEWPNAKMAVTITQDGTFAAEKYVTLNKASIGKGIDIVFVGDGFTEEDLARGGKWQQALDTVNRYMFEVEPLKSYREYFNVYAVAAPFEGSLYSDEPDTTSFAIYNPLKPIGESVTYRYDFQKNRQILDDYAFRKTPVSKDKKNFSEMIVCLLINSDNADYSGWCSTNYINPVESKCLAVAPCGVFAKFCHRSIITHELMGHGFGGFLDEYFWGEDSFPEDAVPERIAQWEKYDVGRNLCFSTTDPERIPEAWYKLSQRDEYKDYVGFFEGHVGFLHGVYHCSKQSVMNSHGLGSDLAVQAYKYYSPVQREILVYRIYKLAGLEEEYTLQTFLDYDVINREMDEYYTKLFR